MLMIRLKRVGRKNDPSYRLLVVDSHQGPKSGKFVEQVGFYNPKTKERKIDGERVTYWMGTGAQVSDTVHNMLVSEKIIEGKKKNVLPKKSPIVAEKAEAEDQSSGEGAEVSEAEKPKETASEEKPKDVEVEATPEKPEEPAEEATPEPKEAEDQSSDGGEGSEPGKEAAPEVGSEDSAQSEGKA